MPLPRARRALLALLAAALLAAAPPRAAAQPPTCIDYEAVLTNTKPGGCQSANVSQALLVSPGTNTTALVFAFATIKPVTNEVLPAPTPTGAPSNRSWTFLVGFDYPFNVTDPATNLTCTGRTVRIKPCKPECRDLALTVNASSADAACSVGILPDLFNAAGFLNATTWVNTSAADALVTIPFSKPPALGARLDQLYFVGEWDVAVQVIYANYKSEVSDTCRVTVTDTTVMGPPVPTNKTCFYTKKKKGFINIPVDDFAARPAGPRCARQRLEAVTCEPSKKGKKDLCTINDAYPVSNEEPVRPHYVKLDLRYTKNRQPLTVTVQTRDLNGGVGSTSAVSINFYKRENKVPATAKPTCVLLR